MQKKYPHTYFAPCTKIYGLTSVFFVFFTMNLFAQASQWDSLKATISPSVSTSLATQYETPYKQPLASYGWEDGVHISRNGLHLYALYFPGDLLEWTFYIQANITSGTFCELFGHDTFVRDYAPTYGMDLDSNLFGCDHFLNTDILYAHRNTTQDSFYTWQLSNIARPAQIEGSPHPLFNEDENNIDLFLFTGDGDIWMIKNTTANPSGIASAERLPSPSINPINKEFNADNPHLEKLGNDTLLLIYEKYENGNERDFMFVHSFDNGQSWGTPAAITSIHHGMGHIEHPHLYFDIENASWYLYFSLDCDIYRAIQNTPNNWDDWGTPELVISKGNASCVGEPTLTAVGDISFVVAYHNASIGINTDTYDIDPWFLPKKKSSVLVSEQDNLNTLSIYPNPFNQHFQIRSEKEKVTKIELYDSFGRLLFSKKNYSVEETIHLDFLPSGMFFLKVCFTGRYETIKLIKQ